MYSLYHFSLCPFSRLARILLSEKKASFKLIELRPWENHSALAAMNPALELPVLLDGGQPICSIYAICEYLEEAIEPVIFYSSSAAKNAEVRRLFHWFNDKFYHEVTKYLVEEKVMSHFLARGEPKSHYIRIARNNLKYHLDYMALLLHSRKWLAADFMSLADLAAASQLSVIDYLGDVDWEKYNIVKDWYSVIKSRPSFRQILIDRVMGFSPPAHYQHLDF